MNARALSPSPIARFLLGLVERRANGSVEVGGRHILLRRGRVVDILPAIGDGDLGAFLRDSGRIDGQAVDEARALAITEGRELGELLVERGLLAESDLRHVVRGLWLDRLVRGLALASAEGHERSPVGADVQIPQAVGENLVTLVLDALARRAQDEDAGAVGSRATHRVEWSVSPHSDVARKWARFPDLPTPQVSSLLMHEPAAAPRIAALVRAGLARIVSGPSIPAPPPRVAAIPPARRTATPPLGSPAPIAIPPEVELDPRLVALFERAEERPPFTLPAFPEAVSELDDPLDPLERRITVLEHHDAPGAERAEAWSAFAGLWLGRYGSLEEAARAYREGAAADERDRNALHRATALCAAIGQPDLAVAYSRAAASVVVGTERGRELWEHALLCRRLGRVSEALGAAKAAGEADPAAPEPPTLAAHLFGELGRYEEAADAADEAADRVRDRDPERALSLVAMAHAMTPHLPKRANAYAAELAERGLVAGAIAVRADAVHRTRDIDARRGLLLSAAEQAELADRPDLAASLLLRAFDAEPHVEALYEPLVADLDAAGSTLERAVVLEEIAAVAGEETRPFWLRQAAEARLDLPGDGAWEAELRVRALELEPEHPEDLSAIRDQALAYADDRLLADALERALLRGRWTGTRPQAEMLEELARLAEEKLDAPVRAAWAWKRLAAIDPSATAPTRQLARLSGALEAASNRAEELTRDYKRTLGDAKLDAAVRLADVLRDDPEQRRRAIGLYRDVLAQKPHESRVADALERTYRLVGDEYHEAATLSLRAKHAASRGERMRVLTKLAALHVLRKDLREAAIACERVLEEMPGHREASIRLRRAASRLKDRELRRRALSAEATALQPTRERARILTALALELEVAGSIEEAIYCAEAALSADPGSAEAALIVARHLGVVEEPRAALAMVRAQFGDSPPILEAWARVARDSGEREVMSDALEAWARVAPHAPEPCEMRLTAFLAAESDDALAEAIEGALAPERVVPDLARPIARAIAQLGEREPLRGAQLACRAADMLGPNGDALRELAGRLADASGAPETRRDALERRLVVSDPSTRLTLLHDLATLHRESEDRAAEARTCLRVLATAPHDRRALDRLVDLYAETGRVDRLMAALALELEAAADVDARRRTLVRLAAASAHLAGDLDKAEAFLRELWGPKDDDEEGLYLASDALVALGRARAAVELLRESGRQLPARRAGPIFRAAAKVSLRRVDDPRLALATAVDGLEHAPGSGPLLILFEQIALDLRDVDVVARVFQRLMDGAMGPHGRRALAYRRARWLERAGATAAALDAYLAAFELHPQAGAIYSSIERLARGLGQLESLVHAAMVLSERAGHPAVRASMAKEAARILEYELAQPERAFHLLADLWEHGGHTELEPDLLRLVGVLAERPDRGDAAFERLREVLARRAEEAWMGEARARLLVRQGRLFYTVRGDLDAADRLVNEALSAVREEGGEPDTEAGFLCDLAEWRLDASERDAACAHVEAALALRPEHARARALGEQLGLEVPALPDPEFAFGAPEEAASSKETAPSEETPTAPSLADFGPENEALVIAEQPSTPSPGDPSPDAAATGRTPFTAALFDEADEAVVLPEDDTPTAHRAEEADPSADATTNTPPAGETVDGPTAETRTTLRDAPVGRRTTLRAGSATGGGEAVEPDSSLEHGIAETGAPDDETPDEPASDVTSGVAEDAAAGADEGASNADRDPPPSEEDTPTSDARASAATLPAASDSAPAEDAGRTSIAAWTPAAPPPSPEPAVAPRAPSVPPPAGVEDTTREAVALERRADEALREGADADAAEWLRRALAAERPRLSAARKLAELGGPADPMALSLSRSLVALVDPDVRPTGPWPAPRTRRSQLTLDPRWDGPRRLWRTLWEQATPLFRERLPPTVSENDRMTRVATSPEGRAFVTTIERLALREMPPFYLDRTSAERPRALRTLPCVIVAGAGFAPDETRMRFHLGHAHGQSLPGHVLPATLPRSRAESVIAAVKAAFGPADGNDDVPREAASLAAELWRTVPTRGQNEIRSQLIRAEDFEDLTGMTDEVRACALRTGLLACGDLGAALLAATGAPLRSVAEVEESLSTHADAAALVRFAFEALR